MNRSTLLALGVFLGIFTIGAVDIATHLRVEQIRADYERQIRDLRADYVDNLDLTRRRVEELEDYVRVVDGLARETHGSLKRHAKHGGARPERPMPVPAFR